MSALDVSLLSFMSRRLRVRRNYFPLERIRGLEPLVWERGISRDNDGNVFDISPNQDETEIKRNLANIIVRRFGCGGNGKRIKLVSKSLLSYSYCAVSHKR